jgi:hypothetical protein
MAQLQEYAQTRQIDGEPKRRWFSSSDLDLIVWYDESEKPFAFQLCYGKQESEHALTWQPGEGFEHTAVDSGEQRSLHHKGSPMLVPDGAFDRDRVSRMFDDSAAELPAPVFELVTSVLAAYPQSPPAPAQRSAAA